MGEVGAQEDEDAYTALPTLLPLSAPVVQVACGAAHCVALRDDALVCTWGWGALGALGHGDRADCSAPRIVEALRGLRCRHVAAGRYHTLALAVPGGSERSDVYGWGACGAEPGADPLAGSADAPVRMQLLTSAHVHSIACGWDLCAAAGEAGGVAIWIGSWHAPRWAETQRLAAVRVPLGGVSCGFRHVAICTEEGDLYVVRLAPDGLGFEAPCPIADLNGRCVGCAAGGALTAALVRAEPEGRGEAGAATQRVRLVLVVHATARVDGRPLLVDAAELLTAEEQRRSCAAGGGPCCLLALSAGGTPCADLAARARRWVRAIGSGAPASSGWAAWGATGAAWDEPAAGAAGARLLEPLLGGPPLVGMAVGGGGPRPEHAHLLRAGRSSPASPERRGSRRAGDFGPMGAALVSAGAGLPPLPPLLLFPAAHAPPSAPVGQGAPLGRAAGSAQAGSGRAGSPMRVRAVSPLWWQQPRAAGAAHPPAGDEAALHERFEPPPSSPPSPGSARSVGRPLERAQPQPRAHSLPASPTHRQARCCSPPSGPRSRSPSPPYPRNAGAAAAAPVAGGRGAVWQGAERAAGGDVRPSPGSPPLFRPRSRSASPGPAYPPEQGRRASAGGSAARWQAGTPSPPACGGLGVGRAGWADGLAGSVAHGERAAAAGGQPLHSVAQPSEVSPWPVPLPRTLPRQAAATSARPTSYVQPPWAEPRAPRSPPPPRSPPLASARWRGGGELGGSGLNIGPAHFVPLSPPLAGARGLGGGGPSTGPPQFVPLSPPPAPPLPPLLFPASPPPAGAAASAAPPQPPPPLQLPTAQHVGAGAAPREQAEEGGGEGEQHTPLAAAALFLQELQRARTLAGRRALRAWRARASGRQLLRARIGHLLGTRVRSAAAEAVWNLRVHAALRARALGRARQQAAALRARRSARGLAVWRAASSELVLASAELALARAALRRRAAALALASLAAWRARVRTTLRSAAAVGVAAARAGRRAALRAWSAGAALRALALRRGRLIRLRRAALAWRGDAAGARERRRTRRQLHAALRAWAIGLAALRTRECDRRRRARAKSQAAARRVLSRWAAHTSQRQRQQRRAADAARSRTPTLLAGGSSARRRLLLLGAFEALSSEMRSRAINQLARAHARAAAAARAVRLWALRARRLRWALRSAGLMAAARAAERARRELRSWRLLCAILQRAAAAGGNARRAHRRGALRAWKRASARSRARGVGAARRVARAFDRLWRSAFAAAEAARLLQAAHRRRLASACSLWRDAAEHGPREVLRAAAAQARALSAALADGGGSEAPHPVLAVPQLTPSRPPSSPAAAALRPRMLSGYDKVARALSRWMGALSEGEAVRAWRQAVGAMRVERRADVHSLLGMTAQSRQRNAEAGPQHVALAGYDTGSGSTGRREYELNEAAARTSSCESEGWHGASAHVDATRWRQHLSVSVHPACALSPSGRPIEGAR